MKKLAIVLVLVVFMFSGCIAQTAMDYGRNIACDKLNDEKFIAEQEVKVMALAQTGFRAGVALAKAALACKTISE